MIALLIIALLASANCGSQLKEYVLEIQRSVDNNKQSTFTFTMLTKHRNGPSDTVNVRVRRSGFFKRTEMGKMIVAEDKNDVVFIMHAEKRILIRQQNPDPLQTPDALKTLLAHLDSPKTTTCKRNDDGSHSFAVDISGTKGANGASELRIDVDTVGKISNATTIYDTRHPNEFVTMYDVSLAATPFSENISVPAVTLVYDGGAHTRKEFKHYTILDMRKKK